MRIAIFETEHFELLPPLLALFDTETNHITIFTNSHCFHMISDQRKNHQRCHWIVNKQSKYAFIFRMYRLLRAEKTDLLFLSTVSDNFIFYAWMVRMLKHTRTILTLHDINTHFSHRKKFSVRRWLRILGKKELIKSITEFNVLSLPMVEYLKSKLPSEKTVHCVPGVVVKEVMQTGKRQEKKEGILLVVPGSIDEKRRDYEQVFELLHRAKKAALPLKVILLGAAYDEKGEEVLKLAEKYAEANNNLVVFGQEVIKQEEYDRLLSEADLILMPTRVQTVISDDIEETYGVSKSSGTVSDVIRHAKPFIAPQRLQIDRFLEKSCLRYNDVHDVLHHLKRLLEDPMFLENLQQAAIDASRRYTPEEIRKRNQLLFTPAAKR